MRRLLFAFAIALIALPAVAQKELRHAPPPKQLAVMNGLLGQYRGEMRFFGVPEEKSAQEKEREREEKAGKREEDDDENVLIGLNVQRVLSEHYVQVDLTFGEPKEGFETRLMVLWDEAGKKYRAWLFMPFAFADAGGRELAQSEIEVSANRIAYGSGGDSRIVLLKKGANVLLTHELRDKGKWVPDRKSTLHPVFKPKPAKAGKAKPKPKPKRERDEDDD